MNKIYIIHGIFGSGKSTWARDFVEKNPNTKIVNLDAIRYMLNGKQKYVIEDDKAVVVIANQVIRILGYFNFDIIIDCGNLTEDLRSKWKVFTRKFQKILVLFPIKDRKWHVDNRMKDPKGQTRQYWEDYYAAQWSQYQKPDEDNYDEVIEVKEWKDE